MPVTWASRWRCVPASTEVSPLPERGRETHSGKAPGGEARTGEAPAGEACARCLRRSWLLAELSPLLDYKRGDPGRLLDLLALDDVRLIAAVGGRRRDELAARHAAWRGGGGSPPRHAVCRHDPAWPPALHAPLAPHALHLSAPAAGLAEPAARPCVALVGTSRPSDYGRAMAGHLARRLSLAGITVIAALREGVAAAAHRGVLDAGGAPFALLDHGRGRATGAALRALRQAVETAGLLAAELPGGADGRCWGARAADRTALTLAAAVVLVEDEVEGPASFAAELARQQGRPVGAVPGPVTSRLSAGPNALIAAGAALLADAADVLDLLALPVPPHSSEGPAPAAHAATGGHTGLEPPLLALLERIGAGTDTAEALLAGETGRDETVAMLAELELLGLVTRTRAGRYVAREPARARR